MLSVQSPTKVEVTLDKAIRKGLERPEFRRSQTLTSDRSLSDAELARLLLRPQFTGLSHVTTGLNSSLGLGDLLFQRDRLEFQALIPIYDGGKARADYHAAKATSTATNESLRVERVALSEQIASRFIAAFQAEAHLKVSHQFQTYAAAHLVDAKARLELGDATKAEVQAAEAVVARAKSDVAKDSATAEDNETRLALLMGLDIAGGLPRPVLPDLLILKETNLSQLVTLAEGASPELKQLQAELDSAGFHLASTKALYGVEVHGVAGAGYLGYSNPFSVTASPSRGFAYIGIQGSLPLFRGQDLKVAVRGETDNVELKKVAIVKAREELEVEVRVAFAYYKAARESLDANKEALTAAKEAFRLTKERYAIGRGTQIEVLSALSNLNLAEDEVTNSQTVWDVAILKLNRLTSGSPL